MASTWHMAGISKMGNAMKESVWIVTFDFWDKRIEICDYESCAYLAKVSNTPEICSCWNEADLVWIVVTIPRIQRI